MAIYETERSKGKQPYQRMKAYYIMQYLLRETDKDHVIKISQIIEYLDMYGISAEEKSIYKDIQEINIALWLEYNYKSLDDDLIHIKEALEALKDEDEKFVVYDKSKKGYKVVRRLFELEDIRMLIEGIYSSKYLSQDSADYLVENIKTLVSKEQAKKIKTDALVVDRVRSINSDMLNCLATVYEAIDANQKISFKYMKYNFNNLSEMVTRKGGAQIKVSPFKIIINDGYYYLLAYIEKYNSIRTYRIDRMKNAEIVEEPREGEEEFNKIELDNYTQRVFSMFGGNEENVCMEFTMHLLDTAVEKFGRKNVNYRKIDEHHFLLNSNVEVSQQFFGWVCGFGGEVKITSPQKVVDEFKEYIDKLRSSYV